MLAALLIAAPAAAQAPAPAPHLKISGTRFVRADGRPFQWRGITAFRLVEMQAAGRGKDVDAYLRWAASERLTVVRVLAMAKHLFELPPERGIASLETLLAAARRHGITVEVVALADTAAYSFDLRAHVRRIGEICARYANAVVEVANEPYHPTQRAEVHDPRYLLQLRALIQASVPTALGTGDYPDILTGGDYVTVHYPRSIAHGGWGWVAGLKDALEHLRRAGKPVIDDEPIGAGEKDEPGRRDASPERYRASALAGRMLGLGSTFHYEGGLQAHRPAGRALACFRAWQEAWRLIPAGVQLQPFAPGAAAPVREVRGTRAEVFLAQSGDRAWVLAIGAGRDLSVSWGAGWRVAAAREWPSSRFYEARRLSARRSR